MFDKTIRNIKRSVMDRIAANLPDVNRRISFYNMKTLHTLYFNYGARDELMSRFSLMEKSQWQWQYGHPDQWLVYMGCLLEKENYKKAKSILRTYVSVHGLSGVERLLPLARFARDEGYTNEKIRESRRIYDTLKANCESGRFARYLTGKSIAFVGNGPQEEGKGRGAEIDSHDVVIRLNNFSLTGHEADYGLKTDLWFRGTWGMIDRSDDDLAFIVFAHNYFRIFLDESQIEELKAYLQKKGERIIIINRGFIWDDYMNPTTGRRALDMLYHELGTLENVDIYGMSFPYTSTTDLSHYYDYVSREDALAPHNMYVELAFLKELYYVKGGGKNPPLSRDTAQLDEDY